MMTDILQYLQWAIPSGGIGAAIAWIANRKVTSAKNAKVINDTYKDMYLGMSETAKNLQSKYEETIEKIEELNSENAKTRAAVNRLTRAVKAIEICPNRANCPVYDELSVDGEDDICQPGKDGKPARGKGQHHKSDHSAADAPGGEG